MGCKKKSWVAVEFERICNTDANDLDQYEAAIKSKMGDDPNEDDFVVAYQQVEWDEAEKRRAPHRPKAKPGNESWKRYMELGRYAEKNDRYNPDWIYENVLDAEDSDELLQDTAELPAGIMEVNKLGPPIAPSSESWRIDHDLFRSIFVRVAAYRIMELHNRGQHEQANKEMKALLKLIAAQDVDVVMLSALFTAGQWSSILTAALETKSLRVEDLQVVVEHADLRNVVMQSFFRAAHREYHAYNPCSISYPHEELAFQYVKDECQCEYTDPKWLTASDAIRANIEDDKRQFHIVTKMFDWQAANPGDFLDPAYANDFCAQIGENRLLDHTYNYAELPALLTAIKVRAIWLEGLRDKAFKAKAKEIANDAKLDLTFRRHGFTLHFLEGHIEREKYPDDPILTVSTKQWS